MIAMEKPELKSRLEQVKTHIQTHRHAYIAGAVCLTAGVAGGAAIVRTGIKDIVTITVEGDGNNVVGKADNINQFVVNLIERSTPSKPVHLVGTNLYFNSLSEAARETGHHLSMISKNVNGHIPDVKGDVFQFLEPAA